MSMSPEVNSCVLLADRHHGLTEGVRSLLATSFDTVVMVADEASLFATIGRLQPALAVVDLSLHQGEGFRWLQRLRSANAGLRLIVLSVHDEPSVHRAALEAGADAFVPKRAVGTDLLPAVDAVLAKEPTTLPERLEPRERASTIQQTNAGNKDTRTAK